MANCKGYVKDYCDHTTVHGLSFLSRQNSTSFKVFWSFIVCISFAGLTFHLYNIIDSYLQYKSTESTYERRNGFKFPDVTVCNWNGISFTNLEHAAKKFNNVRSFYKHFKVSVHNLNNLSQDQEPEYEIPVRENVLFWGFGNEAKHIGHRKQDMILSCKFAREPCEEDDFVLFQFPQLFNCYTFKRGRHPGLITKHGLGESLSLVLYMETKDTLVLTQKYNDKFLLSGNTGIRVLLTPPNHLAAIDFAGYDVSPGYTTSIGFDITEHHRLSQPYSECRKRQSLKLGGDVPYSYVECRNLCIHKIVKEKCGCVPTKFVTREKHFDESCGYHVFSNKTRSDGMQKCQNIEISKIQKETNFNKACDCYAPCDETKYSVTMSQSQWPDRKILNSFIRTQIENHPNQQKSKIYQYYQKLKIDNATSDQIYSWVKSHFLRVNIFANSYIVSVKEQIPMYTLTDLLCQIGGCLGLWLGISIITIVEVFNLVVKLFIDIFSPKTLLNRPDK